MLPSSNCFLWYPVSSTIIPIRVSQYGDIVIYCDIPRNFIDKHLCWSAADSGKCFHETFAKCLIVTILMKICEQQLLSWQMRDVKMFWILWFSSLPTEEFIFGTVTGPIYFPVTWQLTWYSIKMQGSQRSEKTWKIVLFQKVRKNLKKPREKKQNHDKVREKSGNFVSR